MHAIRQHEFGPAETLRYEEVPDPVPGAEQVRIAVEAAGLHLIDTKIRAGFSGGPLSPPQLPMTPGREVAGTVDLLGPGADEHWRGRRVVAHLGQANGGYAELALAPAASLHEIPGDLSAEAAVAMIGTGRTAIGILDTAALTADDAVLVTAAAGGLGALFLQAARNAGAFAVGVAGGAAEDRARTRARRRRRGRLLRSPAGPSASATRSASARRASCSTASAASSAAPRWSCSAPAGGCCCSASPPASATEVTTRDLMARGLTVTLGDPARAAQARRAARARDARARRGGGGPARPARRAALPARRGRRRA